jgi:hypothetical protein
LRSSLARWKPTVRRDDRAVDRLHAPGDTMKFAS